jgi:hypothetical protein
VRTRFTHCIDVVPTILELVGIPAPKMVDGIEQEPMDGASFAYAFDEAKAAERHTVQYFEMLGSRAIYRDGWWACARLDKIPWDFTPETMKRFAPGAYDPDQDVWELYYLPDDFSQARNLAAKHPEKLAELKEVFRQEAERNRALPLLAAFSVFMGDLPPMPTITRLTFAGDVQDVQTPVVPRIFGRSYAIEAELKVPKDGAEGVLVAYGDFIGGYALWIDEKRLLNHTYQFPGIDTYKQTSIEPIPTGDVTLKMLFEIDEPKPGAGGQGDAVGQRQKDWRRPDAADGVPALLDLRRHGRRPRQWRRVDLAYENKAPYAFTGTVKRVVFDLKPVHPEAEAALHQHHASQTVAAGIAG